MKTRTIIEPMEGSFKISHEDSFVALGSCFAQSIGDRLRKYKFRGSVNPFGTIFNPVSLCRLMKSTIDSPSDLMQRFIERDDRWISYDYHSDISASTPASLYKEILTIQQTMIKVLSSSKVFIITLGTAIVYTLNSDNEIVANCHKQPSALFTKKILSIEEIFSSLMSIIQMAKDLNPDVDILLTVSPVRHTRNTLALNSRSKAHLLSAIHQVIDLRTDTSYFPAYEILMDDLRDYRYYKEDMIHPTEQAIDYVWDLFQQAYFPPETKELISELSKLYRAIEHRPFNASTNAHQNFVKATLTKATALQSSYRINLSSEIESIRQVLLT